MSGGEVVMWVLIGVVVFAVVLRRAWHEQRK